MQQLTLWQNIAVWFLPVLFAITAHEMAHGWVANKLGDKTAWLLGRVTLNPIKHIDPIGTILFPAICLFLGSGFVFGWAKPVPVNWRNLKNKKRDPALVAVAGPVSNLIMALIWAVFAKLGVILHAQGLNAAIFLSYMGFAGIAINVMLLLLNLLPIPPLDGSRVVSSLLPARLSTLYDSIEPFGFMILILLLATRSLNFILSPAYEFTEQFIINTIVR